MNRRKFKSKDKKKQDHQRARKTHDVANQRSSSLIIFQPEASLTAGKRKRKSDKRKKQKGKTRPSEKANNSRDARKARPPQTSPCDNIPTKLDDYTYLDDYWMLEHHQQPQQRRKSSWIVTNWDDISNSIKASHGKGSLYQLLDLDGGVDKHTPLVLKKRHHRNKSIHQAIQDDEMSNFATSLALLRNHDKMKRKMATKRDSEITQF